MQRNQSAHTSSFFLFFYLQLHIIPNLISLKQTCSSRNDFHLVLLCVTFAVVFFTLSLWTMTDTQERVVINQNTNGLIFEFLRRLENSFITSERFIYRTIAVVVVVVAVFYHKHAINSHEARFETTVEAIQKLEKKMVRELNVLRGLLGR